MKIRILGCHGSDLLLRKADGTNSYRSCGFLLDDHILIDVGTGPSVLSLEEQQQIRYVLLSHIHMDHVKELAPLVDNLFGFYDSTLQVLSSSEILEGLQRYIFNDLVFPNFFALPSSQNPIVSPYPLPLDVKTKVSSYRVTPIKVNHVVSTVGFIVENDQAAFIYSGDTYSTEAIWAAATNLPHLKAVFMESSFPNKMSDLARDSKHLTPFLVAQEFKKIGRPDVQLYVYHLKPQYRNEIITQLLELGISSLSVLQEGQEIVL